MQVALFHDILSCSDHSKHSLKDDFASIFHICFVSLESLHQVRGFKWISSDIFKVCILPNFSFVIIFSSKSPSGSFCDHFQNRQLIVPPTFFVHLLIIPFLNILKHFFISFRIQDPLGISIQSFLGCLVLGALLLFPKTNEFRNRCLLI